MSLERRNPIPPGYYWQDAFGDDANKVREWLRRNQGAVKTLASTPYTNPDGVWVSFQVLSPTSNVGFPGYPSILPSPTSTQADTSTGEAAAKGVRESYEQNPFKDVTDPVKPLAKNVASGISDALPSKWVFYAAIGVVGLVALAVVSTNARAVVGR